MTDVFISYAREDRDSARRLAESLEGRGWTVWWDHSLRSGESFRKTIERRLREAKAVIVLWSAHSVESSFVLDEASRALRRDVLAPVVVDDIDPHHFPLGFGDLHAEDLSGWMGESEHEGFGKLLDLLTSRIGPPAPPAAAADPEGSRAFRDLPPSDRPTRSPKAPSGARGQEASSSGRAAMASQEQDYSKLLRRAYSVSVALGALLLVPALMTGQDWNMWLGLGVPTISWGFVGFLFVRRSVVGAAVLAAMSVIMGLMIFMTAPG